MYQRNIIASFRDYDDANAAASELSRAGFGDIQLRILPPRTTYGRYRNQQIIVSAILNGDHAREAENILALNGGAIDLHEDANWGGNRWDDRRGGFASQAAQRRPVRHQQQRDSWLHDLPWGTIAGATVAVLTGFAFLRGSQLFDKQHEDYAAGQIRRNSRSFRSATDASSYPDGGRFRSLGARRGSRAMQMADQTDLAWGDHDADDAAPLYDRPAGSGSFQTGAAVRSPSNQGFGSGQNATSNDGGTPQVGIGTGTGLAHGSGQDSRASSNLGAGSATGAGSGVGLAAAHGRDQAGTAATRYAND
ncbi:MAG: hypothetical protein JWO64_2745 [Hyphomicrobiales bacterium]|nr:hypothetical protein [Hyphomicrobiales bacterium]